MDQYFQISDRTRTLEHQYMGVLARKLKMEVLLVEEDYQELERRYAELEGAMSYMKEEHMEEVGRQNEEIGRLCHERDLMRVKAEEMDERNRCLMEKLKEALERKRADELRLMGEINKMNEVVRETETRIKEDESNENVNNAMWTSGMKRMDEIYEVVKAAESKLCEMLSNMQTECDKHKSSIEKMNAEMNEMRAKHAAGMKENEIIKESKMQAEEELKRVRHENEVLNGKNLKLMEDSDALCRVTRSLEEKDEIICALKENMKQKSEVIEMQKRMIESGAQKSVVSRDVICNVFDDIIEAEESGNDLMLDEGCADIDELGIDRQISGVGVYGLNANVTSAKKDVGVITRKQPAKKSGSLGAAKRSRMCKSKDALKAQPKVVLQKNNNVKETKANDGASMPTIKKSPVKRLLASGGLVMPENSSYFADLTFNNSSPVIKKDMSRLPKKK
ncbi:hypothetical protein HK407_09g13940 [Ordospora pajunii]|uniref:uncharacterized protein n=1 Tax=Ordospora pajunii TaxID=3039483 RepID=UPI0029526ABE|nr:uncharacterized protein HK407_09g13940 [Ordospora pajunii]KAH9410980.1 hypothetical protein HK407_09g13940 [Ordospora pajunii]